MFGLRHISAGGGLRPWAALAAAASTAVALLASSTIRPAQARQDPAPGSSSPSELVEAQINLARRALKLIDQSSSMGAPVDNAQGRTYGWSRRLMAAQVSLAATEPDPHASRLAAFEAHYNRMRGWEERLRPRVRSGQLSSLDFAEAEFYRLEAETWMANEKMEPPPKPVK